MLCEGEAEGSRNNNAMHTEHSFGRREVVGFPFVPGERCRYRAQQSLPQSLVFSEIPTQTPIRDGCVRSGGERLLRYG